MNFLALIIALSLHQVIKPGNPLQRDDWLLAYDRLLTKYLSGAGLRLTVVLVSLGLIAAWILDAMGASIGRGTSRLVSRVGLRSPISERC